MFLYMIKGSALLGAAFLVLAFANSSYAQSSDQSFPTPIATNEISGIIPARDLGDPRLTTYYFTFLGRRGDVFINIYTTNFNGAIDIFTAQGLNPRTKITVYADNPERETGRVIYQRRDERLILRIQGRTPNDDPATYRVKFAGTFTPILSNGGTPGEMPEISGAQGEVRVNSAGGIIPSEPGEGRRTAADRPTAGNERADGVPETRLPEAQAKKSAAGEQPSEGVADDKGEEIDKRTGDVGGDKPDMRQRDAARDATEAAKMAAEGADVAGDRADKAAAEKKPGKPLVIITDELTPADENARDVTVDISPKKKDVSAVVTIEMVPADADDTPKNLAGAKEKKGAGKEPQPAANKPGEKESAAEQPSKPANPLDKVHLRVELKDGTLIERRMSEVLSVNVMNGILVIVTNDGRREISILDVLKMTIQ